MRKDRLLGFRRNPVQQIHRLGLAVVVGGDLLIEQLYEERLQVKSASMSRTF